MWPSINTNSLLAYMLLKPRQLIAQVLELICATSSPGARRRASGMQVAPQRRIISVGDHKHRRRRPPYRARLLRHRGHRRVHQGTAGRSDRRLRQLLDVQVEQLFQAAGFALRRRRRLRRSLGRLFRVVCRRELFSHTKCGHCREKRPMRHAILAPKLPRCPMSCPLDLVPPSNRSVDAAGNVGRIRAQGAVILQMLILQRF